MRILKYAFFVVLLGSLSFLYLFEEPQKAPNFFDKNNRATDDVVRLLGLTGIRVENDPLPSDPDWPEAKLVLKTRSLKDINEATQGMLDPKVAWKRANNQERWQMELATPLTSQQIQKIREIYTKLGLFEEVKPQKISYKGILFLGSTLKSVRPRLAFLNQLLDSKACTANKVYVLTGERVLSPEVGETKEALLNPKNGIIAFRPEWTPPQQLPNNETDMVKLVFTQSRHPSLKEEDIIYVHSLKATGYSRATTESTVYKWLELCKPEPGVYLAISSQPYVYYQQLVIQNALLKAKRSDIQVHTVGPAASYKDSSPITEQYTAELLDNLARIFYGLVESTKLQQGS